MPSNSDKAAATVAEANLFSEVLCARLLFVCTQFGGNRHKHAATHYTSLLWHQVNNLLLIYRVKTLCIYLHEHQPFYIPRMAGCAIEEERFASFPHRCRHQYTQFALYNFNFWSSFIGFKVFHLKFSKAFVTFSASTLKCLT